MYYFVKIFVIFFLIHSFKTDSVDDFYNYVTAKLKELESYERPTDNKKLFSPLTSSAKVENYGNYDFVIVGGGSAGAVLANRLSEVKKWKILLLEAGGELNRFSDVPAFNNYLQSTDMNWGYLTSSQTTCCQGMKNNQCVYPRGKVIGGTSTLNGAIYARGVPDDYNEWVAAGNPGWSYEEVLPYFKKSEYVALNLYDKPYHGTSGVLYVNHTSPPSAVAEAFLNANLEKGLKEVDYNGRSQVGVSRIQFNIKDNIHQNSAHAFLNSTLRTSRKNLEIVLNAAVNKLQIKRDKVKGVTFVKDGVLYNVKATKEVILSAGSINTPQILMLSGIGPGGDLKKFGIPIINNLPAVGKHLQDHPLFVNIYFRTNVSADDDLKNNLDKYFKGATPLTNGAGLEQLAFINFNGKKDKGDVELITFAPPYSVPKDVKVAYNFEDEYSNVYNKYDPKSDISIIMSLMKPKSEGTVTIKSNSILDFPLINLNYFSDPNNEDLETLYKGIKYVLSLEDTEAFKKIDAHYIGEQPGCEQLKDNDREYWYCALRHMTSTEYHPSGTTKMGLTPIDSVVNTNCLVHNLRNLRIVDAGVIPIITRGHLNAAIYMIAEKISDVIKKTHLV